MLFIRNFCEKWLQQAPLIGGIYFHDEAAVFVVVTRVKGNWKLVFARQLNHASKFEGSELTVTGTKTPFALEKVSLHVVSEEFQVFPLILPPEVPPAEVISCAELKLQQQEKPDDWLWDIELSKQNSRLWLLAKAHYNSLLELINLSGMQSNQLCSWKPLMLAERKLKTAERLLTPLFADNAHLEQYSLGAGVSKRELALATAAAICVIEA